jgi:hypothetical protein
MAADAHAWTDAMCHSTLASSVHFLVHFSQPVTGTNTGVP